MVVTPLLIVNVVIVSICALVCVYMVKRWVKLVAKAEERSRLVIETAEHLLAAIAITKKHNNASPYRDQFQSCQHKYWEREVLDVNLKICELCGDVELTRKDRAQRARAA